MTNLMQVIVEGVHARIAQELRHPPVRSVEWACWHCGASGPGYMPEEHASRACEPTRTMPRMDPGVALATHHMVRTMLDGALYMDGGGI